MPKPKPKPKLKNEQAEIRLAAVICKRRRHHNAELKNTHRTAAQRILPVKYGQSFP